MSKITPWTKAEIQYLIDWNERVISQYSTQLQIELREYRTKFLSGIPIVN